MKAYYTPEALRSFTLLVLLIGAIAIFLAHRFGFFKKLFIPSLIALFLGYAYSALTELFTFGFYQGNLITAFLPFLHGIFYSSPPFPLNGL